MIRHVALLTFKPGTTPKQITNLETALRALRTPGLIRLTFGLDLGLMAGRTPGDITFAIVADLEDTAAFHRYDTDPEHQRLRKEHTQPMTQSAARAQYEI